MDGPVEQPWKSRKQSTERGTREVKVLRELFIPANWGGSEVNKYLTSVSHVSTEITPERPDLCMH